MYESPTELELIARARRTELLRGRRSQRDRTGRRR